MQTMVRTVRSRGSNWLFLDLFDSVKWALYATWKLFTINKNQINNHNFHWIIDTQFKHYGTSNKLDGTVVLISEICTDYFDYLYRLNMCHFTFDYFYYFEFEYYTYNIPTQYTLSTAVWICIPTQCSTIVLNFTESNYRIAVLWLHDAVVVVAVAVFYSHWAALHLDCEANAIHINTV